MTTQIQLLPDHVANQIAAGEVVQRPASVVKELIENAVDAKATEIKLIVKDAGKTLIQVIDNGTGMNVTDARLCFERHATSKIKQAEDLFDLHTKGFRGEALASIAAVAHVELKTKIEAEELGTHILIEGSVITSQDVAVVPKGTSFSVKNLFYNIPARRNFLKSEIVEFRHILDEFQRVALAHPAIHFVLIHNGSEFFNLPATNFRQRIVAVFGGKSNEKLVPISETTDIVTVHGFVSKPEFAKKNKAEQFFFVNDRYIKSGYLHHAIMSAYEGLLKDGNQPAYFLYFDVPRHSIDINIHPTKTEIKFDNEQAIYAILRSSVKHSLGQFNVSPILDFDRDATLDTPYKFKGKIAETPFIEVNPNFNPFKQEQEPQQKKDKDSNSRFTKKENNSNWESLYIGLEEEFTSNSQEIQFESSEVSGSLFSDEEGVSPKKNYQLQRKYIISPIKSGIVVLDQRRAHERILYEQFLTNFTVSKGISQQLLFPLTVFLSAQEKELIKELQVSLEHLGFVLDKYTSEGVMFSGLPQNLQESKVQIVIDDLLSDLQLELPTNSFSQNDLLAKSMAKSLAVKTGKILEETEINSILDALFACKEPNFSPFGKPTYITITTDDLDKRFAL